MFSKTASEVSVFDSMTDEQHAAVLDLLNVIEERIVFKVKHAPKFVVPSQALRMAEVMQHLVTLVEGVIRLEHAAENGIFSSDAARKRVLNSIVKDVLGHTRADKPR